MKNKILTTHYLLLTNKGYVTLISVLVIGAAGLAMVISSALLSLGSSRTSLTLEQSSQAEALANACAEMALQNIWNWDTNTGTDTLSLGQGDCSYVISSETVPKTITASGSVGSVVRNVSITIDSLHPYVHLLSWQDIAN